MTRDGIVLSANASEGWAAGKRQVLMGEKAPHRRRADAYEMRNFERMKSPADGWQNLEEIGHSLCTI